MEHLWATVWGSFTEELASAVFNKLERDFELGLNLGATNQERTLAPCNAEIREALVKIPQAGVELSIPKKPPSAGATAQSTNYPPFEQMEIKIGESLFYARGDTTSQAKSTRLSCPRPAGGGR